MGELEAEEAAQRLGMKKASFLTRMSQLNGTPAEIRLPKQPGRRSRVYDEDKLLAWDAAGRPAPDSRPALARPDATSVVAEAAFDGHAWTLRTEEEHLASSPSLGGAIEQLRMVLAKARHGATEDFRIDVHYKDGEESQDLWDRSRKARRKARELRQQAVQLEHDACLALDAKGISKTDIALLFGVHRTTVQRVFSGESDD